MHTFLFKICQSTFVALCFGCLCWNLWCCLLYLSLYGWKLYLDIIAVQLQSTFSFLR